MPSEDGSLRDRLIAIVLAWAESIAEAPTCVTAMAWLALGPDFGQLPELVRPAPRTAREIRSLRERIAQQYAAPFDAIFDSPEAAELSDIDRSRAFALLIGPVVLGRLSTLPDFDYRECARAAVDGFLKCIARRTRHSTHLVANRQVLEAADESRREALAFRSVRWTSAAEAVR